MADQDPVAGGPGDGQAQDTVYAAFLKAHDAQSSGPAGAATGVPKASAAPDTGAPADSGYQAFLSAHDQQTGPPAADHASDAPSDGVGIAGAPSSPFQAVAQDMGHGVLSAPAGLLGTPRALGHGVVGAFAGDNPTLHKAVDSATDFLEGPRQAAQSFADRTAPMATDEQLGLGGHPTIAKGVGMAADAVGGLAAGAAGGAVAGRLGQALRGGGVKPIIAGQLENAAKATGPAYTAAGPQILSHPDIDRFVQSTVPEIKDAATAATDALNIRAARMGVAPAHMTQLQNAVARGNPQQTIQALGLTPEQANAALAALPGGPTTVDRFDLIRRGVKDAVDATYRRAASGTAAPADISRARQLGQWVDAVTPIADKQVPEYAAARTAATNEHDLGRVADYLGDRDTPGIGDLARLVGNGIHASRGSVPAGIRLANAASRFMQAGADATTTLGPRERGILNNARLSASRQALTKGAVTGAGTTVGRLQSRGSS